MNESFDAELRKRLRQYSEDPDIRLWNSIITRSEEKRRPLTSRKRKRLGWMLLGILVMVGGFYYLPDTDAERSSTVPATIQMPTREPQREAENVEDETASLLPLHDASSRENELIPNSSRAIEKGTEEKMPANKIRSELNVEDDTALLLPLHHASSRESELIPNSSRAVEKWTEEKMPANKIPGEVENVEAETTSLSQYEVSSNENELTQNSDRSIEKALEEKMLHDRDSVSSARRELEASSSHLRVEEEVTNISDVNQSAINKKNKVTPAEKKVNQKKRSLNGVKTIIPEKRHNRFDIYFTIMPTFGYQRIKSNSTDNIIIESIAKISAFSMDRLGVRAELGVEDPITEKIKVFGGLVFYQRKQTIDYTERQVESTEVTQGPDGEIIIVPKFANVQKSFEYDVQNLGLQVGVIYQLSKKKLLQTMGTGFEFHVALNKLNQNEQIPEFTNNPSAYVFYNFYYRLQYPAEGRLKAVFQPTLNYSFYIDQNLNAPFYIKPYGLGLNVGCTYNF